MRNRPVILAILSIFAIYLASCTRDKIAPVVNDCTGETPVWEGNVDAIVALTCAYVGCHVSGSSAPGNYLTYNGINSILQNGKFKTSVFDVMDMPPNNSSGPKELTAEQLNTLSCWMEADFPEN